MKKQQPQPESGPSPDAVTEEMVLKAHRGDRPEPKPEREAEYAKLAELQGKITPLLWELAALYERTMLWLGTNVESVFQTDIDNALQYCLWRRNQWLSASADEECIKDSFSPKALPEFMQRAEIEQQLGEALDHE